MCTKYDDFVCQKSAHAFLEKLFVFLLGKINAMIVQSFMTSVQKVFYGYTHFGP